MDNRSIEDHLKYEDQKLELIEQRLQDYVRLQETRHQEIDRRIKSIENKSIDWKAWVGILLLVAIPVVKSLVDISHGLVKIETQLIHHAQFKEKIEKRLERLEHPR
jgi:DNA repair exonuclease SbcCD ATPase subunit